MAKKILVADDDVDFCSTLCDFLESKGYQTIQAHEGVRSVELAHKELPDLVLLDWQMPAGKGSAVLEMLKEKENTRKIPVIVLTGADEPFEKETAFELGAADFIRKPLDHKELLSTIDAILKKSA